MAKKMPDLYSSFKELERSETKEDDYVIQIERRDSPVAIIAIHSGQIELHTTPIARAIAHDMYNFYSFVGLKRRPHRELHITSHNFDEPQCVTVVKQCNIIVAIHGRKNERDQKTTYLGGLDIKLKNYVSAALKEAGFPTKTDGHQFPAKRAENICNQGRQKRGVQLELPITLRRDLVSDAAKLERFSNAVRKAIQAYC